MYKLKNDKLYCFPTLTHRVIASHSLSIKWKITGQNTIKRLAILLKKKMLDTERERERERELSIPSSNLEHCRKHLEKEKSMGINTVRLHICHHQIVGTSSGTFSSIFFRFEYEILLFIEFFCWIGLDFILV